MYLKDINIRNFRNYKNLSVEFIDGINIIYGNNGQGKTNLLESLYVLGMTKSHRSYIDNNLIKNDEIAFKIKGTLCVDKINTKLEISASESEKKLKINKNDVKKVSDYISTMNIIIFYPDDLSLIKGSPSERRRFLNSEISQLYSEYLTILNDYQKLLKMRNDCLKKNRIDENYFKIITDYLIEKACIIYKMRYKFILKINESVGKIYENLCGIENFNIIYKTSIMFDSFEKDSIKKSLNDLYKKNYEKEIKNKATLFGPHRDELEFLIGNDNIKNFGSQGQQRMAILAIKLAEIAIFRQYKGNTPILLLDDVFSELDRKKRNSLIEYIKNDIQTIITTTDLSNINKKLRDEAKLIEIKNGNINKITEVM